MEVGVHVAVRTARLQDGAWREGTRYVRRDVRQIVTCPDVVDPITDMMMESGIVVYGGKFVTVTRWAGTRDDEPTTEWITDGILVEQQFCDAKELYWNAAVAF